MKYTEILKQEVELYLERLKSYRDTDFSKAKKILEDAAIVTSEARKKEISELEAEATKIGEQIELYNEYESLSSSLNESIFKKITSEIELKELNQQRTKSSSLNLEKQKSLTSTISELNKKIKVDYERLLEIRKGVCNFIHDIPISGSDSKKIEFLKKQQEDTSETLQQMKVFSTINLLEKLSESERAEVIPYINSITRIIIKGKVIRHTDYPNLLQLLALATFKKECGECAPVLNDSFSIDCRRMFTGICNFIMHNEAEIKCHGLRDMAYEKEIVPNYSIDAQGGRLGFHIEEQENNCTFLFVSEAFLNSILGQIEKDPEINLPRLAIALFDTYDMDAPERYLASNMSRSVTAIDKLIQMRKKFQSLYEETPEQIMVREQRYYQEQRIEELKEKNRLEEERIEQERELAEEAREQAERQWQREQKLAEERWKEEQRREDMRREEELKRERMERKKQEERENREKREKQRNEEKARQDAMHLCWRCANLGHGCHGGIPSCGNFRAK